jgi:hypothetical protein
VGPHFTAAVGALLIATLTAPAEAEPRPPAQPTRAAAAAQSDSAAADVDRLPISVDRIREQLDREPALWIETLNALNIPVFRTETRSDLVFRPDPNYWKDDDVAGYARPQVNRWHNDFQKMVNPNLPTGYGPGGGVDVLPGLQSIFSGFKHASQERERVRVRQQIKEELHAIDARRQAGLPPLDSAATDSKSKKSSAKTPPASGDAPAASPAPPATIKVGGPPD